MVPLASIASATPPPTAVLGSRVWAVGSVPVVGSDPSIPVVANDPLSTAIPRIAPSLSPWLTVALVVLAALLLSAAIVTLGYSLRAARHRRRRELIRADLRSGLLERLYGGDDPDWDSWVSALSAAEREELESVLDVYLRELDGSDARRLAALGTALGIDDRARRDIANGDYWDRIHALRWLVLLRDAPDRTLLTTHCLGTPRERATAARVLYASDATDLETTGIDILLTDEPSAFSVFGIDTLYRVAIGDPQPLFERAAADFDTWDPALQQQVLLATRHLHTVVGSADISWIIGALTTSDERVRAAAWRALDAYGWNRLLRDEIDLASIDAEPSPVVRASAYRMLGTWGDAEAIGALWDAASVEPDERAQVAVATSLYPHCARGVSSESIPDGFSAPWSWASEHARFDAIARDISVIRDGPLVETQTPSLSGGDR